MVIYMCMHALHLCCFCTFRARALSCQFLAHISRHFVLCTCESFIPVVRSVCVPCVVIHDVWMESLAYYGLYNNATIYPEHAHGQFRVCLSADKKISLNVVT